MATFTVDREKLAKLARPSHTLCYGTGISGYRTKTYYAVICSCVANALLKKGLNIHDSMSQKKVREAIGKDEERRES